MLLEVADDANSLGQLEGRAREVDNSRGLFDIQLPESRGGGLMERSADGRSVGGGGSLDVRVEIEGRV